MDIDQLAQPVLTKVHPASEKRLEGLDPLNCRHQPVWFVGQALIETVPSSATRMTCPFIQEQHIVGLGRSDAHVDQFREQGGADSELTRSGIVRGVPSILPPVE
jgi:hypothetical protein